MRFWAQIGITGPRRPKCEKLKIFSPFFAESGARLIISVLSTHLLAHEFVPAAVSLPEVVDDVLDESEVPFL